MRDVIEVPVAWRYDRRALERGEFLGQALKPVELFPGRLLQVDVCGLGAVLVHRSVLGKLEFRWSSDSPLFFEEFCFGRDCRRMGLDIFLDSSLVCGHHTARGC